MAEETKDPRDLNGDGKVTLGEKVQYYAGKAGEKVEKATDQAFSEVKEDAKEESAEAADKAKAKIDEFKAKKA